MTGRFCWLGIDREKQPLVKVSDSTHFRCPKSHNVQLFNPQPEEPISGLQSQQSCNLRRKRILVVSGTLSGGGAERFTSTLLQHLDRSKFKLSLALFRDEIAYPLAQDVDVSILGHRGPLTSSKTVRRLARVIDSTKPDLILSTMDYLGMFVGEALRRCNERPFWIARTSNNPDFLFRSVRGRCRKAWLNRVYPAADLFVANSVGLAKSFQRTFPCAIGRTQVVLNPVDIQRIESLSQAEWPEAIDTSHPNLFFSARLQAHKRPDVLIEAFRIICRDSPAKLWMCGEGPMRGRIENMIEKYELRKHVRMVGFRENIFPLLKSSTIAVATSDYEGLPNNLLEAQALGVPVVSTRSCFGPEEIIQNNHTGLLTERGDPVEVAKAIMRLLKNQDLRNEISARAQKEVIQKFGVPSTIPLWENLLGEGVESDQIDRINRKAAA